MKHILAALVATGLSASFASAQQPATALTPGQLHTDSLAGEETDTFTVALEADRFVLGEVDQQTVDVVITVLGPDGERITRVDFSARGPEVFQFDTEAAGLHRIEVEPFEEGTGSYEIVLLRVEPVATQPEDRVGQLMAAYDRDDVPGGVVAVVRRGELAFAEAYGMANLTHSVPFTTTTASNIGSTSKQFTAFALVLLDQRGKLSLDDDVRTHIPELKDFGQTVTLRNLLTHTSGYREFLNTVALAGRRLDEGDYIDRGELVEVVRRQPELQNAPGAEFNYNNTGFGLLTVVVERVTGQPFDEWMEENVFRPLGMSSTVVRAHRARIVPNSAQGYVPAEEGGWREASDLGAAMGAGGIYTTVGDLARWMGNFESGQVGGDEFFRRMTTRFVLADGDTTGYGLGLFVGEQRGLRRVQHGGADVAHRSSFSYYPEIDAGVIVLSNNASFSGRIPVELAEAFLGEHMEPEEEAVATPEEGEAFDPADYDPAAFDPLTGQYALDEMPSFVLTFTREGDQLFTQATGQSRLEIVPTSDSTFALTGVEASVTFHRGPEGGADSLTLHQNGDHLARRIAGWDPAPEELAEYTGRYFSEELATFYTIAVDGDGLVLRHRRMEDLELEPGSEADAFTGGFPAAEVAFRRDETGRVTGLAVSNGRTRGVEFERVPPGPGGEV